MAKFPQYEKNREKAMNIMGFRIVEALKTKLGLPNDPTGETTFQQRGKFTGNLQASIRHEIRGNELIIKMPKYAEYLEFGIPHPVDDPDGLRDWVRLKLLKGAANEGKVDAIAKAIAKKIETQGQIPFPFIKLTYKQDVPKIISGSLKDAFHP